MKLYFAPGACSMAPHIVLREAGYTFELAKVDLAQKTAANGADYTKINPKGYVPALQLDDGQILTEGVAILHYLADQKPQCNLAPKAGTMARYRLLEWMNFIASEVHKTLGALYNPRITAEWKANQLSVFGQRCEFLEQRLSNNPYLMGDTFSVADAYLFTVLNWTHHLGVDMGRWPALGTYMARVAARPAVQNTMAAEGLLK